MIYPLTIPDLLSSSFSLPIVDVRTPAEFAHGHIPGALNLPLFSNEERVQVGTTYKQTGREAAILLGFDLVGSKWSSFIRQALEFSPSKKIAVHCWRGGMRSEAMAWALNFYGFDVYVLKGGYKSYRRWILQQFEKNYQMRVIGGITGAGKTRMLQQLQAMGQPIIDLEALAQHQGSSYGSMNKMVQPTQEQFENNFGYLLSRFNSQDIIWVEDESISIGKRFIPKPFWDQMQEAVLFDLQVDPVHRLQNLVEEYGSLDKTFLTECTERIRKRLGFDQTKKAITAIQEGHMEDFIKVVIVYYDKTYKAGIAKRPPQNVVPVSLDCQNIADDAEKVLQAAEGCTLMSANDN
jgi:tRNA 2-selenouridine synthase